ncbi:hypothetical protein CRENBAI_009630 [Crenichthys baileyi]|uniref:Uncharacterized protein n=1 Tax=Crenichthys baileyi TaxID=28760 RepID=A0AAV9RDJ7_9TELE
MLCSVAPLRAACLPLIQTHLKMKQKRVLHLYVIGSFKPILRGRCSETFWSNTPESTGGNSSSVVWFYRVLLMTQLSDPGVLKQSYSPPGPEFGSPESGARGLLSS